MPDEKPLKAIAGSSDKLLTLGGSKIECYVLENNMRVLSGRGMQEALDMGQSHGSKFKEFINKDAIKPLVDADLAMVLESPVKFTRPGRGGLPALGYEASALPRLCDRILEARRQNKLTTTYELRVAQQAEILLGGLAEIGIIALVDEVTGFQKRKDDYQKILELYIAKELRPWVMTFDENYYKQLYRLLGWDWDAFKTNKKNHPQYVGKLTNRLVYEKLAPGVLEELDRINPRGAKGRRKHKHHQHLSESHGYRELLKHIASVSILMEQFEDGDLTGAIQKIDARFPTHQPFYQTTMDFPANRESFEQLTQAASLPAPSKGGKMATR